MSDIINVRIIDTVNVGGIDKKITMSPFCIPESGDRIELSVKNETRQYLVINKIFHHAISRFANFQDKSIEASITIRVRELKS